MKDELAYNLPHPVICVSDAELIAWANGAALDLIGPTIVGCSIGDFMASSSLPWSQVLEALRTGNVPEMKFNLGEGDELSCLVSYAPLGDQHMLTLQPMGGVSYSAKMWHSTQSDPLTGLPGRNVIRDRIDQSLRLGRRKPSANFGVIFLDLNGFKPVNDTYGHAVGDLVLKEVAVRLSGTLRDSDSVSRLGGDEFLVFMNSLKDAGDSRVVAERVLNAISRPMLIADHVINVTASVGVALYPNDATEVDALLSCADMAMYSIKHSGKSGILFYDKKMNESVIERKSIETDLRSALLNKNFVLHYQPQFRLFDRTIIGVEALIRWKHPEKGMIAPDKFIRVAEESNMICEIGEWVLEEAIRQCKFWIENHGYKIRIAVNVSPRQFVTGFPARVSEMLSNYKLNGEHIELELTESLLVTDMTKTKELLAQLRDLGIKTSVDDFGTGFSCLNYLQQFPLDTLKIDRSFIGRTAGEFQHKMVRAILAIAKEFNLTTLAEGVETEEQLRMLRDAGCDQMQGFLLAKPMPAEDVPTFFENYSPFPRLAAVVNG